MEESHIPDATFPVLVTRFATEAALALGQIEHPVTKQSEVNLPQAKFAIDLLQILSDKTKGNLEDGEEKLLSDCLYQLRMVYIDKAGK